jgi:hypothetical protein
MMIFLSLFFGFFIVTYIKIEQNIVVLRHGNLGQFFDVIVDLQVSGREGRGCYWPISLFE